MPNYGQTRSCDSRSLSGETLASPQGLAATPPQNTKLQRGPGGSSTCPQLQAEAARSERPAAPVLKGNQDGSAGRRAFISGSLMLCIHPKPFTVQPSKNVIQLSRSQALGASPASSECVGGTLRQRMAVNSALPSISRGSVSLSGQIVPKRHPGEVALLKCNHGAKWISCSQGT